MYIYSLQIKWDYKKNLTLATIPEESLTFSGRSTHICTLKGKVEVAKVHIFVQSGI
jgi:hypothetical protein